MNVPSSEINTNVENQSDLQHHLVQASKGTCLNDMNRRAKGMCSNTQCTECTRGKKDTSRRGTSTFFCLECCKWLHPKCFQVFEHDDKKWRKDKRFLKNKTAKKLGDSNQYDEA